MQIIRPIEITDTELNSTTAVETDPTYNPATTYALGAYVIYNKRRYESLQASNTGNTPGAVGSTWWLDVGPSNQWAMFDQINGTQTTGTDSIVTELTIASRLDSLALLNLDAAEVTVVAETAAAVEVYNETYSLVDNDEVTDWYQYFFLETSRGTELIVSDIPRYAGMTITVTVSDTGAQVAIGSMIFGTVHDLGLTLAGARVGIIDYSRKEADDFGNYSLVERAFAKRANFSVIVEGTSMADVGGRVDAVHRILSQYRAAPLVWVGSDSYDSTTIFGFYRSFEVDVAYPTHSVLSLEIEGLT